MVYRERGGAEGNICLLPKGEGNEGGKTGVTPFNEGSIRGEAPFFERGAKKETEKCGEGGRVFFSTAEEPFLERTKGGSFSGAE